MQLQALLLQSQKKAQWPLLPMCPRNHCQQIQQQQPAMICLQSQQQEGRTR
jgi:hypothetical protein